jgi:hypothetical protein
MLEQTDLLPIVYQDIPEFDQCTQCVVQLEAEVGEDEVFYPCAVVTLPAEEDAKSLPISEIGTTSIAELEASGFVVEKVAVEVVDVVKEATDGTQIL